MKLLYILKRTRSWSHDFFNYLNLMTSVMHGWKTTFSLEEKGDRIFCWHFEWKVQWFLVSFFSMKVCFLTKKWFQAPSVTSPLHGWDKRTGKFPVLQCLPFLHSGFVVTFQLCIMQLQKAAKLLDTGAVRATRFLWRYPTARLLLLFYLVRFSCPLPQKFLELGLRSMMSP